jgi:hypothetical protein
MQRTPQVIILIGKRKTGKTTFGRKIIEGTQHKKILVVDTFDHPDYKDFQTITTAMLPRWKSGRKRILYRSDEDLQAINEHVRNTLIVLEDCTKYITGDISAPMKGIIFDSKQKNNDVLLMYHGFSFAPPKLLANVNYITLFKIGENIDNYKSKIPNYETIHRAHLSIQASKDPYINKTFLVN